MGPLDQSTYQNNYCIIDCSRFCNKTKYNEAVPLKGREAEWVAEALVDTCVFSRVDVPREMLSDIGAQFTSVLKSELSRLLSMRNLTTTTYRPKCNGLVENIK